MKKPLLLIATLILLYFIFASICLYLDITVFVANLFHIPLCIYIGWNWEDIYKKFFNK